MSKTNINQWIKNFDLGAYEGRPIEAGWYDWFCKESSLNAKTKSLGAKLKGIADSKKFDNEKCYVFFKNNCPMSGPLYDDFRICDIESGDVIYCVIPKSGHTGKAEVWGKENDFNGAIAVFDTWKELKAWFNA